MPTIRDRSGLVLLAALVVLILGGCTPNRVDLLWVSQVQSLELTTSSSPTVWVSVMDTTGDAFEGVSSIEPAVWSALESRGYRPASDPASADYILRASLRAMIEDPFTSQEGKNKLLAVGGGAAIGLGVQQTVEAAAPSQSGFFGVISGIFSGIFATLSLEYFLQEREYVMLIDVNLGRKLEQPAQVDQRVAVVNRAIDLNASAGENVSEAAGLNLSATMIGEFDSDKTPGDGAYIQSLTLHHTQNPNTIGVFAKGRQLERGEAYRMMIPKIENALAGVFPRLSPRRGGD